MGRFLNGMFIGTGIALLVAPMRGEEMRSLVRQRFAELRGSLPEKVQPDAPGKQATSQAQQTTESVSELAKRPARQAQQAGQNVASAQKEGTETGGPTTAPLPSAAPRYVNPRPQANG